LERCKEDVSETAVAAIEFTVEDNYLIKCSSINKKVWSKPIY